MAETKHGGARKGAGRKKGQLDQKTLDAMAVKKEYQDRIRRNATKIFNAQYSLAVGTQMLFVIHTDSKGNRRKPEMVTDPEIISKFLEENEGMAGTMGDNDSEYFFMTTKVPDSRTISDMLDRAMGKPDATLDVTSGGNELKTALVRFVGGDEPGKK